LNIYIYGNNGFKKDIHETLEHANIKFKLDSNSEIKDIDELEDLKTAIENNPNDIYLIDDEKIIKKNKLSQKIKFLAPKDGIEEEFLLDNGIADLSVDSLKEIPKYIIKRYEQLKTSENTDIQNSIIEIVDEAYNEDESNMDFELDDELAKLLASDNSSSSMDVSSKSNSDYEPSTFEENDKSQTVDTMGEIEALMEDKTPEDVPTNINLDEMESLIENASSDDENEEELSKEELSSLINFDEDVGLNNVSADYDDENTVQSEDDDKTSEDLELENEEDLSNENEFLSELDNIDISKTDDAKENIEELELKNDKLMEAIEGESMSDEFAELENLNEEDILEALNGFENVKAVKADAPVPSTTNEKVSLESSNVDDLAGLISKLLNNKTLEITIKIKD